MGRIRYDGFDQPFEVEDTELAHLRMVIVTKLRQNERFLLRLQGQGELWMTPTAELRFEFDAPEGSQLDADRLAELRREAAGGAILVPARAVPDSHGGGSDSHGVVPDERGDEDEARR